VTKPGVQEFENQQRRAAKTVGIAYLMALGPALFSEFYVRGLLVVPGDAAQTAANVLLHERLVRLGVISNLVDCAIDIILITALYIVLKPVQRQLALLALGWGLVETGVLIAATVNDFEVLSILSNAGYLRAFAPPQLQTMARLSISAHAATYGVGLFFAGLRSTAFCYLWLRSGLIPKVLAGWGIFASALMCISIALLMVMPELGRIISVAIYGSPIFIFELAMGLLLLVRPLQLPNTRFAVS